MLFKKRKASYTAIFSFSVFVIITFVVITLMLIFIINLYSITYRQTESIVSERIAHLKSNIEAVLLQYEDTLINTAYGISALLGRGYIPSADMNVFLSNTAARIPEMEMLYFFNNHVWNSPGGYYATSDEWIPLDTWDNTARPWFINAKNAGGDVSFSDPYVDAYTGDIVISISVTVFDRNNNDIGVAAADILVTDLGAMIGHNMIMANQEIFLLNRDSLFIAHSDASAVMQENFFTLFSLERYRDSALSSEIFSVMDNDVYLYSALIPAADWILISVIPRADIFAETNSFIWFLVQISILILVIFVLITALFTYRILTIPLRKILKVSNALASMDFSVDIDKFRNDEIGDIQESLLKIRDSLKSSIDSLQQHLSEK
jgi:methyl-accepting chemotaxis protein